MYFNAAKKCADATGRMEIRGAGHRCSSCSLPVRREMLCGVSGALRISSDISQRSPSSSIELRNDPGNGSSMETSARIRQTHSCMGSFSPPNQMRNNHTGIITRLSTLRKITVFCTRAFSIKPRSYADFQVCK